MGVLRPIFEVKLFKSIIYRTQFAVRRLPLFRLISINTTVRYARPGPSYGRLTWWITSRQYLCVVTSFFPATLPPPSPGLSRRVGGNFRRRVRRDTKQTRQSGLRMTSANVGFNFVGVIKPCVLSRPIARSYRRDPWALHTPRRLRSASLST